MYIDIPSCSSCSGTETTLIKWRCPTSTARSILQLAHGDKKNFDDQVRKHYGLPIGEDFIIRIRMPEAPDEYIDYKWEKRMLCLLMKYFELEHLMWRMSTLGGACSAMADYDLSFAKRAGSISEKQLRIAAELDDQTLLARCHLYIALSEAQQANFDNAKRIVRVIYVWSRRTNNLFVEHCCRGVFAKIKAIERFGTKALREGSHALQSIQE
uniref:FERM domain-containing protein n=1 Tax=Haemonchus contortus TaxID=6289 RepID=A0A7I4YBX7_HAECO|nr:uncharacterized protein F58A4.6-like [Haemonchus contortus]